MRPHSPGARRRFSVSLCARVGWTVRRREVGSFPSTKLKGEREREEAWWGEEKERDVVGKRKRRRGGGGGGGGRKKER